MKQLAAAIFTLNSGVPYNYGIRIPSVAYRIGLTLLILFLFIAEILRVYLVMPFPGSQEYDTVGIAHWITVNMTWIRIITGAAFVTAMIRAVKSGKRWAQIGLSVLLLVYILIAALISYRFAANAIFHQPSQRSFIPATQSIDKTKLVIGVEINGVAKAYPIQLIGYHHQVTDTIAGQPVIITYCTVCRTGRVYSSLVNGHHESFRLVGMDHFNAVFEDATTKSWWQQANGEAIAGSLKGSSLKEITSMQMTIEAWIRQYPNSVVMEGDPKYDERYFRLEDYDRGAMQSELVKRDLRPWQPKSWIVGVKNNEAATAYDWNDLVTKRLIQDSVQTMPILVAMEDDTISFHVYDRRVNGAILQFNSKLTDNCFTDTGTSSRWNMSGLCIDGPLKGKQLSSVQAYNEFWHSFERFQGNVKRFGE